jgi:hypothetical protein
MISKRPPPNPAFELIANHLAQVTVELFAAYDIPVELSGIGAVPSTAETEPSAVASIGFAGDQVRGVLIMLATESAVTAWMNAAGAADGELTDTLGEFSNMLLGRLKGRLLVEGLKVMLATPTTASGNGLRFSAPPSQSTWQVFDGPGWKVNTRLDATFCDGFALQQLDDREKPAEAGDGILF